jgi:hypothetical protein
MRACVILIVLMAFLSGCATYKVELGRDAALSSQRRLWVKTNLDDNHSIHRVLVEVLRSHGFDVESGPLTMMPRDRQLIITYRDRWTWDFRNHLTALEMTLQDARTEKPVGAAVFVGPASLTTSPRPVVERLVGDLLKAVPGESDVLRP